MRLRQAWKIVNRYYSKLAAQTWRKVFDDPDIVFREVSNRKMQAAHARVDKHSKREKRERREKRQRELAAGCVCTVEVNGHYLHHEGCPARGNAIPS